jgi:alpha-1,2-mannosyltransferase
MARVTADIDWRRLGRRSLIAAMAVLAVSQLVLVSVGTQYGFDFRGGTWQAGRALLHGTSPYPTPNPANLLHVANGFIDPPPLAVIGAPFALLPFPVAVILWNLSCASAFVLALRVAGVTDRRLYVLALGSFPFVSSLALGQPDGLLALLAALAWRYRDSPRGAIAAGTLIAAKLLAWPLVVWLLVTRRTRLAGIAALSGGAWLAASWACIGFKGLLAYPHLLAADAAAFGPRSHSFVAAISRLGLHLPAVQLGTLIGVAVGVAVVVRARGSDRGSFAAAIVAGLLCSPILWQHYLVLLFVCLAVLRRFRDPLVWLLMALLWLSPGETPATEWQAWLVPVIAATVVIRAARAERRSPQPSTGPYAIPAVRTY